MLEEKALFEHDRKEAEKKHHQLTAKIAADRAAYMEAKKLEMEHQKFEAAEKARIAQEKFDWEV